jgi:hypothetical protein
MCTQKETVSIDRRTVEHVVSFFNGINRPLGVNRGLVGLWLD